MIFARSSNFAPNPCEMLAVKMPSIAPQWYSRKTPKKAPGRFIKQQMKRKREGKWLQTFTRDKNEKTAERCVDQCYPRKAHECALVEEFSVMPVSKNLTRCNKNQLSYLTKGSLILEKFMKVYSLYPTSAKMGSIMYWCVASKYTPTVNGRISQHLVLRLASKKINTNAVHNAPNSAIKPVISRSIMLGATMFPRAFARKNPGNASRSMAWKT